MAEFIFQQAARAGAAARGRQVAPPVASPVTPAIRYGYGTGHQRPSTCTGILRIFNRDPAFYRIERVFLKILRKWRRFVKSLAFLIIECRKREEN
jgi:hypothetical protein